MRSKTIDMNKLPERTALVTGAGSGLGRTIAVALAQETRTVVIVGRREDRLRETESKIAAAMTPARVEIFSADISSEPDVIALDELLTEKNLAPDILVNNAGIHGYITSIEESDPTRWMETLSTNLFGPYLLTRMALRYMKRSCWGRIINVSSASSLSVGNIGSEYSLSKVALNHFTRQVAKEVAGIEISATAIHPGEVKTEMWETIRDDANSRGESGAGAREWSKMVGESGGDPPEKAAELVVRIARSDAVDVNDRFMWIRDGIQASREVW